MDIKVEIKGLRELQARFNSLPKEVQVEAKAVVEAGAKTWVQKAKRAAPVDNGTLKNGISYYDSSKGPLIGFTIVSNAKYSAYLEWGTITKVEVPAELSEYALQFKGKGILKTGGITPHPFFFPQQLPVKKQIEAGLKSLVASIKV